MVSKLSALLAVTAILLLLFATNTNHLTDSKWVFGPHPLEVDSIKQNSNLSVLFIGNSLIGSNNHIGYHIAEMSLERDKEFQFGRVHNGNTALWDHLYRSDVAVKRINESGWDIVILQGWWWGSTNKTAYKSAVVEFDKIIKAKGAETWLFEAPPGVWCADINEPSCPNYSINDEIKAVNREIAQDIDVTIIPALTAWQKVYEDRLEIELYTTDGVHAEMSGTYLNALVVYTMLFENDPIGMEYRMNELAIIPPATKDSPTTQKAQTLQEVARFVHMNESFGFRVG